MDWKCAKMTLLREKEDTFSWETLNRWFVYYHSLSLLFTFWILSSFLHCFSRFFVLFSLISERIVGRKHKHVTLFRRKTKSILESYNPSEKKRRRLKRVLKKAVKSETQPSMITIIKCQQQVNNTRPYKWQFQVSSQHSQTIRDSQRDNGSLNDPKVIK